MKATVIGGCGFLGSRVSAQLYSAGAQVDVADIASFPLAAPKHIPHHMLSVMDVSRIREVTRRDHGVLINLAAVHRDDVRPTSLYDDVNVQGARNVCAAATENGIQKIIFTSSVAVYGFAPLNTDETGEHNFFND